MINSSSRRLSWTLLGLCSLAVSFVHCFPVGAAAIGRENFGNMFVEARSYLKITSLPKNSLPPEKQREFDKAWREALGSALDVQNQWEKAFAKDDLLQRAIDGFRERIH